MLTIYYSKVISDGYISGVCTSASRFDTNEIDEDTAKQLFGILANRPTPPAGFGYRLKADLTWEQYELPAADPDPDLTAEEALSIIMGGTNDA